MTAEFPWLTLLILFPLAAALPIPWLPAFTTKNSDREQYCSVKKNYRLRQAEEAEEAEEAGEAGGEEKSLSEQYWSASAIHSRLGVCQFCPDLLNVYICLQIFQQFRSCPLITSVF